LHYEYLQQFVNKWAAQTWYIMKSRSSRLTSRIICKDYSTFWNAAHLYSPSLHVSCSASRRPRRLATMQTREVCESDAMLQLQQLALVLRQCLELVERWLSSVSWMNEESWAGMARSHCTNHAAVCRFWLQDMPAMQPASALASVAFYSWRADLLERSRSVGRSAAGDEQELCVGWRRLWVSEWGATDRRRNVGRTLVMSSRSTAASWRQLQQTLQCSADRPTDRCRRSYSSVQYSLFTARCTSA